MDIKLSSKYQLVIPKEIRRKLNLKKGQRFHILVRKGIISLVPNYSLSELRGILKGIEIGGLRDEEERI